MSGKNNLTDEVRPNGFPQRPTRFSKPSRSFRTLNCRGRLIIIDHPLIMGILNLTPDSFFDGGKFNSVDAALKHAGQMLEEGADIIDLGAYSSRPGAEDISEKEELKRMIPALETIVKRFPDALISIDTFRSGVAEKALEIGAHIINDISGGNLDEALPSVAARFNAPYICMHMRGTPQTMQQNLAVETPCMASQTTQPTEKHPTETPCMASLQEFFVQRVPELVRQGVNDVIIDPGFGFGKTLEQNYELVDRLADFAIFGKPILVGVSRKSMIQLKYGKTKEETLKGTIEVNRQLLQNGADILRVHDVKETVQLVNS
ncbi:MAG: dihydropteroate synthase, partial [Flavobacteriales bacterium]|nr:dihydropteroate synthase [Flavobacteriales bacterium]